MMKETKQGTYIRNGESYVFEFYTDLSASDKLRFVNSVVDIVVSESDYNSIVRNLMFDYIVVKIFTDVDMEEIQNSDNMIDAIEDFLLKTNIVEIVKANAFPTLFDELEKAVDKSIEYKTGIHTNPLNDALSSLLSTLEKKIEEVDLSSMMEMANVFCSMTGEVTPESVVNAYLNSDVHKQNLAAIEESKKQNSVIAENLDTAIKTVNSNKKSSKSKK